MKPNCTSNQKNVAQGRLKLPVLDMVVSRRLVCSVTRFSACAAALLLTSPSPTRADTIVSSLSNALSLVLFSSSQWAGSSFQTDGQFWSLSSATVGMAQGAADHSTATLQLFSDNAGTPGIALADLGSQTVTNGYSLYTFAAASMITLNPFTTYWIGVGNVETNRALNVGLLLTDPFTYSGVPGASMTNSVSTGTGFQHTPPTTWTPGGSGLALLFAVDGTPVVVPEPGGALWVLSLVGVVACMDLSKQKMRGRGDHVSAGDESGRAP